MRPGDSGPADDRDVWVALTTEPLVLADAAEWVSRPACGAVVTFSGNVRDHAEGRPGVSELEYEAYASEVEPRLAAIAEETRRKWPAVGRIVVWHRLGVLPVGGCSVIVAVSAGHRGDAFEAARYCIDTVKHGVPIWKRERWEGGEDWGLDAQGIEEVGS